MRLQKRVYEVVSVAEPGDLASKVFDHSLVTIISLNVVGIILESIESIQARAGAALFVLEAVSVVFFTIEYLLRVWSCVADPKYASPVMGRLRFMITPLVVIDLCAILPFYAPFLGADLRFMRVLRLMRFLRLAKLARYFESLRVLGNVLAGRKYELSVTAFVMGLMLIVASCFMYYAENDAQPEAFPSIPSAMWWAVATLTTVGYGDIYPVTATGKLIASVMAVLGIGMFALPAGILGGGFMEEVQKRRGGNKKCPHCGRQLN